MAINLNQQDPNNPQGAQPNNGQPQQQSFKPKTTGFTNLQRVLDANKNNQLGSTINQGVQDVSNKTQNQTQAAQQDFSKDIGTAVDDIKNGQKVQQNLSNLDFGKDSMGASTAIGEVGGDQYTNSTKDLRGGYQGPQGLNNADNLQSQAQQLNQTGQGLLSTGGRQAALQRFVNAGPNYTAGKQQLDNMLLGQNPEALREARRTAMQTASNTNDAVTQAAQQGQFTGQQFNALGQDITQKGNALAQNLGGALTSRVQGRITDSNAQAKMLKDALNSGQLTGAQYDQMVNKVLGGNANTYTLKNNELANLFDANTNFNQSNVASQQEVAARDALARLTGADSGDALLNLDETQTGAANSVANDDFVKNQTNMAAYNKQAADATAAQANFNFATHRVGNGNSYQENYLNPNLNYQQIADVAPIYSNRNFQTTGTPEYEQWKNNIVNTLANNGGTTNAGAFANSFRGIAPEVNLNQAVAQYNDTNTKYGIGNSLARLLKDNKTFGVS